MMTGTPLASETSRPVARGKDPRTGKKWAVRWPPNYRWALEEKSGDIFLICRPAPYHLSTIVTSKRRNATGSAYCRPGDNCHTTWLAATLATKAWQAGRQFGSSRLT